MANSREKGKRLEREAAKYLRELGIDPEARRGVQYSGGPDSSDLDTPALKNVHIEVKGVDKMRDDCALMDAAWEQAREDAGDKVPVVLWKTCRRSWRLTYVDGFGVRVTTTGDDRIKAVLQRVGGDK